MARYYAPYGSKIVSTESYRDSGLGSTPESRSRLLVSGLTKPALSLRPDSVAKMADHFARVSKRVARRAEKELQGYGVVGASGGKDFVSVVPAESPRNEGRGGPIDAAVAMSVEVRVDFVLSPDREDVAAVTQAVSKMLRENKV